MDILISKVGDALHLVSQNTDGDMWLALKGFEGGQPTSFWQPLEGQPALDAAMQIAIVAGWDDIKVAVAI